MRTRTPAAEPERPSVSSELDRYLALGLAPEDTCPVAFWASRRVEFPQLATCARNLQAVTASSAPSERIFSVSGRMFSPLRTRMRDDLLEALMHTKC